MLFKYLHAILTFSLETDLEEYRTVRKSRLADVNSDTTKRMHCRYDYLGRRISKTDVLVKRLLCQRWINEIAAAWGLAMIPDEIASHLTGQAGKHAGSPLQTLPRCWQG
jgi:hypothetical protein